jgi:crotonobetainyl-CoA:carnitine CoA-transferase CaiB-like acyl-CoA transferase
MRPEPERAAVWPIDAESAPDTSLLAGVRILDLSRVLAGPFASMLLSDLGADVIKVERPGTGDVTRTWGPPFHGDDAAYFLAINRNRRSVTLDLNSLAGMEATSELASVADIVLENFLPRQLARLGLDEVRAEHPDLVWISIRGASSDGPLSNSPAYDLLVQGRAGFLSITGAPDSGPTKFGAPAVDLMAGLYAALGAIAGIYRRDVRVEGIGATVEVPLFEVALSALTNHAANYLIAGINGGQSGNDHPSVAPYGTLPTSDGLILVAANNDREFATLCQVAGLVNLTDDPRFASNSSRVRHRDELTTRLAARFTRDTSRVWLEKLGTAAVPSAPINSVGRALTEPQVVADGIVQQVAHPAGFVEILGSPLTVNGHRPRIRRPPPLLGEHNDEVLGKGPAPDPHVEPIQPAE